MCESIIGNPHLGVQAAAVGDQQRQQPAATPAGPEPAATAAQVPWSASRLWDPPFASAPQGAQATEPQQQQFQQSRPTGMQGKQQAPMLDILQC